MESAQEQNSNELPKENTVEKQRVSSKSVHLKKAIWIISTLFLISFVVGLIYWNFDSHNTKESNQQKIGKEDQNIASNEQSETITKREVNTEANSEDSIVEDISNNEGTNSQVENTDNNDKNWKTYENPTYKYTLRYPDTAEIEEYPINECEAEPCIQVDKLGDVISINVDKDKVFINSNEPKYDGFGVGLQSQNYHEPKEFLIGKTTSYAIFSKDGILRNIAYDYKFDDSNILWLKTFYHFDDTYITFDTGYYPMNNISEETFFDSFAPILETFDY